MYALTNCTIYAQQVLTQQALLIDGDSILDLVPQASLGSGVLGSDLTVIDLGGAHLSPGLIDLQLNGCGGVMFNDAITSETLAIMHQTNLKSGTTSFLPTLITASDADMQAAIALVADYRQHSPHSVLGLHLEGPYLNPKRKGIHNGDYVRRPDQAMLEAIAAAGPEVVRLMTLAVEQVEPEQIRLLVERGIVVSAGHTDASYEQAQLGFEAGVSMVTHLFNAMSPWQGRSPGVVGAALERNSVYAGIIADGHHVHFASIGLAHRLKRGRLLLVSDATPPVGTQMTSFRIGGQEVFYQNGKCVSADGTLGGSALTLIEAVANSVHHLGLPVDEALRMASLYPAQAIGVEDRLGQIAPGYIANLAIFNDQFQILGMVDRGEYLPMDGRSFREAML
jgi:N-acetylglucosamine-6-phosphate deacetylase